MTEVRVHADALRAHIADLLTALDVPEGDAAVVADNLVEADLRGVDSHGAHLVALYVGRLRSGHILPVTEVATVRDDGSTVLLDGGLGFGQVAGVRATELAVERARVHGLAAVGVRETTHLGALAYYTERVARTGLVAMAWQNGPVVVPPFGGLDAVFSTNPFSYAVPGLEEPPVVYDVATTTVAGNRVLLAKKRGDATIPEGWANDEQGRPTTDTAAASVDHLQWFGGHKGFGIAMMVEVLAGVLADSCFGRTENTRSEVHGKQRTAKGFLMIAVDPTRFLPGGEFRRRVDVLVRDVRSSRPAAGFDRVMVPGEREHRTREERLRAGIPLPSTLVEELDAMAAELGRSALEREEVA